jgi:hypothetical protein
VYTLSPLPRRSDWKHCFAHPLNRVSLPRYGRRVGLRIDIFEACSAFTRVTACTLALSPYFVTRLPEGFSHFLTSIAAPVAAGAFAGWDLHPLEKRRLCTAHARKETFANDILSRSAPVGRRSGSGQSGHRCSLHYFLVGGLLERQHTDAVRCRSVRS